MLAIPEAEMPRPLYPSLYQVDTRVWLTGISGYVRLPFTDLAGNQWLLLDLTVSEAAVAKIWA